MNTTALMHAHCTSTQGIRSIPARKVFAQSQHPQRCDVNRPSCARAMHLPLCLHAGNRSQPAEGHHEIACTNCCYSLSASCAERSTAAGQH